MRVMAVEFVPHGRLHYLDPGDADYRHGDQVLVPTDGTVTVPLTGEASF